MSNHEQQLEKTQNNYRIHSGTRPKWGQHPQALRLYGIDDDAWSSDDEMFSLIHQMRTRIISSPQFTGERILGSILFENTMDREIGGMASAAYLWNVKQVVPILK